LNEKDSNNEESRGRSPKKSGKSTAGKKSVQKTEKAKSTGKASAKK